MGRIPLPFLVFLLLAGCLEPRVLPPATQEPLLLPEIEVDHDHKDPALHQAAAGLELVGLVDAKDILGTEPARLSDIQFHKNISVVTVNGRTQGSSGGFLVFDVSTPTQPELLARYRSGSEDNWYTKFSPDGSLVFLTANGGAALQPALNGLQQGLSGGGAPTAGARGIHIVDIANPRAPRLVGFYPAPVRVINLAVFVAEDRETYVFASMANDRVSRVTNTAAAHDLNYVSILHLDPSIPKLDEVARWQPTDAGDIADAFPHDLSIALHPNGRALLLAAYWDAGAYVVDVTTPSEPRQVSRIRPLGPGDHIHTFKAHPEPLNTTFYAVVAPETFGGEHPGFYRRIDLTDLRNPRSAGQWQIPPRIEVNPEPLIFSPHEFSLLDGRLYASQFHGGTWVLDLATFQPVATFQKSVGTPARTNDWAIDIETVVKHGPFVYAVDMGSGILVLRETA